MIEKIMGAHFRPPAKPILQNLQSGCPLLIIPEPENQYDSNALAIHVETKHFGDFANMEQMNQDVQYFGTTPEELLVPESWHLGYIRKELAAEIVVYLNGETQNGTLGFTPKGEPAINFALPEK